MRRIVVKLPQMHEGQRKVYNCPARFRVVCAGRRWGKTYLGVVMALETAMRGGQAWWIAPTYAIADIGWQLLRGLATQLPGIQKNENDRFLVFPSGGQARIRTAAEPDRLRGAGLDLVIFDEYAQIDPRAWTECVRPALVDHKGRALFISTPMGHNHFYYLYTYATSAPNWAAFRFPTETNPFVPREEIEIARRELPAEVFAQEFEARFLTETTRVFPPPDKLPILEQPSTVPPFYFGVDWALSRDFTVFIVLNASGQMVYIERMQQIPLGEQLRALQELARTFPPAVMCVERNTVGERLVEELYAAQLPVFPVRMDSQTKVSLITALAFALERHQITLLPDAQLLAELQSFTILRRSPSGVPVYGASTGQHDDCVIALALAYHAFRQSAPLIAWEY